MQMIGTIKDLIVAIVGGLLSSIIFVYLQSLSARLASAPATANRIQAPPREQQVARGMSRIFWMSLKNITLFALGIPLTALFAIVYAAFPAVAGDKSFMFHHTPRATGASEDLFVFVFSIPVFIMSLRSQISNRFARTWSKFFAVTAVFLTLAVVALVILYGDENGGGLVPFPEPSVADGFFVGNFLLLEIFAIICATSHWPSWRSLMWWRR